MKTSFGNIDRNNIVDVAISTVFQRHWQITKEQIRVCRDCEFRMICSDCRAFLHDDYAKPAKCDYDPYAINN